MLQKKLLHGGKVEVTFRMPPLDDVVELYLCGDFNGWKVRGVPFTLEPDGTWVARLVLEEGKSYRFRYHDNQGRWLNDREADAYVPNAFGSEDSVVDLMKVAGKPPKEKAEKKPAMKKVGPGKPRKTSAGRRGKARR
jgi:hypothetical protein